MERATLGGSMSAKQSATSRVAAGIVTPDQYRGTTRTAQIAPDDQMETEAAPDPPPETAHNPMRPVQAPATASGAPAQVWTACTALALLLSVFTSVRPGLGEAPRSKLKRYVTGDTLRVRRNTYGSQWTPTWTRPLSRAPSVRRLR